MQRLVTITLWHAYPVAQAFRTRLVKIGNHRIHLPAIFLLTLLRRCQYDAYGEEVIHFFKGHMLLAHLVPDRVYGFGAAVDLEIKILSLQFFLYRANELVDITRTLALG